MNGLRKVAAGIGRRLAGVPGEWSPPLGSIGVFTVCVLTFGAWQAIAQQAPSRPDAPSTQQAPPQPATQSQTDGKPTAPDAQQPGADAQVHTGTSSGLEADERLQILLADHQFLLLASQLDKMPQEQAQFYRGILANRSNDNKQSIELLEPLVDKVSAGGNFAQEKLLRKALAEDYLRSGDWTKAAKAYQTLDFRLQGHLSPDEVDEIEMPRKLLPLAADNPPMTVEPCDPFKLQVARNPLGLTDIPVFVDARPHAWMLDPTAPFNLISRSLAKEAGLKVSEQSTTIHTLTGKPIEMHVTTIPRFTVGGRLTFRNMTAFVYDDADYYYPATHYQVEGILGYPALAALGSLTITADATIEVRPVKQIVPAAKDDLLTTGARFFLDGEQVIAALGRAGEERMFAVDAGGQQTYLTARFFDEHSPDFASQKMELFTLPGPQGLAPVSAYVAETVPLSVGSSTVEVHYVPVLTQPVGAAALDDVYGLLGVDALDQLRAYTFDYRTMRFAVKTE